MLVARLVVQRMMLIARFGHPPGVDRWLSLSLGGSMAATRRNCHRRTLPHPLELVLMAAGALVLTVIAAIDLILMLNGG
jgi:hypothetical protein